MADQTYVNPNAALQTQGLNGTTPNANTSSNQQPVQSSQTDQLVQHLLGQSDIISSQSTGIESKINDIVSGIKTGQQAGAAALDSNYNRQEALAQKTGDQNLTSAMESQRGFGINTAALKQIQDNTKQQVNDLEQRKQELILQGQAAAAGQISQLQIQSLQFQQQAQQQVFSNLLGITNMSNQQDQFRTTSQLQQKAQTFAQQQAVGTLATQYGLTPAPGETLESLYARAVQDMGPNSPAAMDIAAKRSQINENNAQAAKALSDASANKPLDAANIELLANTYNAVGSPILGQVKNANDQAAIISKANDLEIGNYKSVAQQNFDNRITKSAVIQLAMQDQSIVNKQGAIQAINAVYGNNENPPVKPNSTVSGGFVKFTPPGALPSGGLSSIPPYNFQSSPESQAALKSSLQGTAFGR